MSESIDTLSEKIYHHKTKKYFSEVISSFNLKNYRSAVVMLYTVTVCDLVFKLQDLRDVHNDSKATKILQAMESMKNDEPVSSEWETELIKRTFEEAKLIENDVFTHITTLKKYRNLAAHPVLNSIDILYEPNKDLTRSLIRNMLEGVLTKSPLYTKDIFSPFMEEIQRIKSEFPNDERLSTYLDSKFFVYFSSNLTEYIFKNLWKCIFKNNSEIERDNRNINFRVLKIMYIKNEILLEEFIEKESSYFSEFLDDNKDVLNKLVDFLSEFPDVYKVFRDHAKELLENRISKKNDLLVKAHFLCDSPKDHFMKLDKKFHTHGFYHNQPYSHNYILDRKEINFLKDIAEKHNIIDVFYDLMISHYYHSGSFSISEHLFSYCILPYYSDFSKIQFENLLSEIIFNDQCNDRRNSKVDHKKVLDKALEKYNFDQEFIDKYSNLFS